MDELEQRSLESTRNSVRVLDETLRIGVDTAVELDRQGEQLNRVDRRLDDIDANLVQSNKHLRQVKSVFGGIVNWFSSDKPILTPTPGSGSSEQVEESRRLRQQVERRRAEESAERRAGGSARAAGRQLTAQSAQTQEIDANLDVLSAGLSRLTELSLDMNEELAKQNDQIGKMSGRVEKLDDQVGVLNRKTRRLL